MTRLLSALSALALSCGILSTVAAMPIQGPAARGTARTAVIGAAEPVFLGRMVVTATPL